MASLVLLRLADLTGNESYAEYAEKTLRLLVPWMERAPYGTDTLMLATARYFDRMEERRAAAPEPTLEASEPVTAQKHPVTLTATLPQSRVGPREEFDLAVLLEIADGWHINSHSPRQDFLVPTSVEVAGSVAVTAGEISYPAGRKLSLVGDTLSVYDGRVELAVPVAVGADAAAGPASLALRLRFQACDSTSCLAPDQLELTLPLHIVAAR
jgi:DsbC/DsbD-like thiol-disulfide interchange protein